MPDNHDAPTSDTLQLVLSRNTEWAARMVREDSDFFTRLANRQRPAYLWIGCSDSRVPANQIVDLPPGDVFVHRNVANLVYDADINVQSVIEYSVEALDIREIIVCGHYGCGGISAAMEDGQRGLVDNWLRPVRRLAQANRDELDALPDDEARRNRLCELNVLAQVRHVREATAVSNAASAGKRVRVHGLVYGLADGRLRQLTGACGN